MSTVPLPYARHVPLIISFNGKCLEGGMSPSRMSQMRKLRLTEAQELPEVTLLRRGSVGTWTQATGRQSPELNRHLTPLNSNPKNNWVSLQSLCIAFKAYFLFTYLWVAIPVFSCCVYEAMGVGGGRMQSGEKCHLWIVC